MPNQNRRVAELLKGLQAARADFLAAIADVDPALRTTPGLAGEWSARELLAHVGFWAGHASEAIHRAEEGELADFGAGEITVDERNVIVARVATETDYPTVAAREASAFEAFAELLARADPEWLGEHDASGDSLEEIIGYDGADHYREHTLDIRSWFDGSNDEDEDADDGDDDDETDADEGANPANAEPARE